jgi:ribosome-associated heat shock protein Hsp15
MRLDRLLFFLRLAKSRTLAQKQIEAGHIRVNGERITHCAHPITTGQVLTLVAHGKLRVIRIERMPERRGPPAEAASMICDIQPPVAIDARPD